MEGYLVPFAGEHSDKCERLLSHFTGPKWGGWCAEFIDAETADVIDSILTDVPGRDQIRVDRTKLIDSREAWVHVKIEGPLLGLREHDEPSEAILTWPNSDERCCWSQGESVDEPENCPLPTIDPQLYTKSIIRGLTTITMQGIYKPLVICSQSRAIQRLIFRLSRFCYRCMRLVSKVWSNAVIGSLTPRSCLRILPEI